MLACRNRSNQKDKLLSLPTQRQFKPRRWQFRQSKQK